MNRSAIRNAVATGTFLRAAGVYLFAQDDSAKTSFHEDAIDLHNAGEIDLLGQALAFEAAPAEIEEFELFEFFGRVIPQLDVEVESLIAAVEALDRRGDDKGMGYAPQRGFQNWCASNIARADAASAALSDGRPDPRGLLALALQGGAAIDGPGYFQRAVALTGAGHEDVVAGATLAIGLIERDVSDALNGAAFARFGEIVDAGPSDRVLALLLEAALRLHARGGVSDAALLALLEAARSHAGPQSQFRLSFSLWDNKLAVPDAALDPTFAMLVSVRAEQKGILDNIDRALSRMIGTDRQERALTFIEALLQANEGAIRLKALGSVIRRVRELPALRDLLVIRWLMSGDDRLARAVKPLVAAVSDHPIRLAIDLAGHSFTPAEAAYCARKAIGHLFMYPITAASVLTSLLGNLDGEAAEAVVELLFDPLLINYSGRLRRDLEPLAATNDPAAPRVAEALAKLEAYIQGLRNCGEIAELAPSTRQRMIEQRVKSEKMNRAIKDAGKTSIFSGLFTEMVLLHGHRVINYVPGPHGRRRRMENKLGSVSHVVETPREIATNPQGLEYRLRAFRYERRP